MASLNEMREFFGLKRHETFEDINSDPKTADILRKLYEHPDMVELYPGLFVEDVKKPMNPGSAGMLSNPSILLDYRLMKNTSYPTFHYWARGSLRRRYTSPW